MTGEANAAIAGAFEGGADVVVINDSHVTMDNLLNEDLDPRARVIFGAPKSQCMVEGLLPEHDVALFVGYHAPAGDPGVLAHTFSPHFLGVRLNGAPVSETEINALYAASLGVPIGLVTGDEAICQIAEARMDGVVAVPVKKAHGWSATDSLSPSVAREAIRFGAAGAVASARKLRPMVAPADLLLEIDMPNPTAAELGEQIPGAKRTGNITVSHQTSTVADVIGFIVVSAMVAHNSMVGRGLLWGR
jgi:D-amino peptidase